MTVYSHPTLALVHSPLVSENTWSYLTPALQQRGYPIAVATLRDNRISARHYWDQHLESALHSFLGLSSPYILVGHSGAGPLLPLIAQKMPTSPSGYLFIDAGVLWEPASRLQMMMDEDETWGKEFEAYLRGGGAFPAWIDEQLADILPKPTLRREVIESLRPKGLAFFIERIPIPLGWDNVPCGYLQLSVPYQPYTDAAQAKGWNVERIEGHHFSMITHPDEVAEAIIRLI